MSEREDTPRDDRQHYVDLSEDAFAKSMGSFEPAPPQPNESPVTISVEPASSAEPVEGSPPADYDG